MLNLRVELRQAFLVLGEVVESAVVGLCVPVLGAEDVGALARHLDQADLF